MRSFLVMISALVLFAGCSKKSEKEQQQSQDLDHSFLLGRWEWMSTVSLSSSTYPNPGETTVLEFFDNKTFTQKLNGTITRQGTYRVKNEKSPYNDTYKRVLVFSDNPSENHFVNSKEDLLFIGSSPFVTDGYSSAYIAL